MIIRLIFLPFLQASQTNSLLQQSCHSLGQVSRPCKVRSNLSKRFVIPPSNYRRNSNLNSRLFQRGGRSRGVYRVDKYINTRFLRRHLQISLGKLRDLLERVKTKAEIRRLTTFEILSQIRCEEYQNTRLNERFRMILNSYKTE